MQMGIRTAMKKSCRKNSLYGESVQARLRCWVTRFLWAG